MYINNNYFQYNLYVSKEILSKILFKKKHQAVSTTVSNKLSKDL